jgi:predicted porin
MKKTIIALATLAVVGAASAQSTLNLYGVADVWLGSVRSAGGSTTQLGDDGLASSRLGFKGTEDLGGGLKANFLLEQGLDLTTGSGGSFDRQSYVGLSGGFGAVQLGNTFTAFDDINGAANSGFDSALSATSGVWVGYVSNPMSNIKYIAPEMGGFGGAASFTRNGKGNNLVSVQGNYTAGAVYVGVAYQADEATSFGATKTTHTLVNGSYDFGAFKLLGSLRNVKNPDTGAEKAAEFQFGADVPLSSTLTLSAGYAQSKDETGGVQLEKRTGLGLAVGYSMSKRTTLYGGVQQAKFKVADTTDRLAAVGINHKF